MVINGIYETNLDVNYQMGYTVLGTNVKEKDLGLTISVDMKVPEQCGALLKEKSNSLVD